MHFNPLGQNTGPIQSLPTPTFVLSPAKVQSFPESPPDFTRVRKAVGTVQINWLKNDFNRTRKLSDGENNQPSTPLRGVENNSQSVKLQSDVAQGTPKRNRMIRPFPAMEPKEFYLDEPPYILTSEVGQLDALELLRPINPLKNGIYLGFAFEFNYHLLAERPFELAWICDINSRMHTLYKFIETTIITTPTRDSFIEAFRKELFEKGGYYFSHEGGFAEKVLAHYLNEKFSWLHSEEKFLRIRSLYREHKIHHVNLNLVEDSGYFAQMKMWADDAGFRFDTVYVSNIPEWVQRSDMVSVARMKANLLKIVSPETNFIDARQPNFESGEPKIRLTRGIYDAESFPDFSPPRRVKGLRRVNPAMRSGLASLLIPPHRRKTLSGSKAFLEIILYGISKFIIGYSMEMKKCLFASIRT